MSNFDVSCRASILYRSISHHYLHAMGSGAMQSMLAILWWWWCGLLTVCIASSFASACSTSRDTWYIVCAITARPIFSHLRSAALVFGFSSWWVVRLVSVLFGLILNWVSISFDVGWFGLWCDLSWFWFGFSGRDILVTFCFAEDTLFFQGRT